MEQMPVSEFNKTKAKVSKTGNYKERYNQGKGWLDLDGKRYYYKSKWERNFVRYLDMLKKKGTIADWDYEKERFLFEKIKSGTRLYVPDFIVTSNEGKKEYYEVKGYMDAKSKTKIERFRRYFPNLPLEVIDANWFAKNNRLKNYIEGWEKQ
jgi:hypothetical protein